ncbi:thioredoxin domain-containing protein [Persicirhabdus sediminis]|uniref:Thioredoxin domain-containing protein n=2 Tax=Persicirhabdus sediminis TaxID=454144 RepID=A0A8J7MBS2_9BACT|nr:thioredoxin domain-containing protein [Persicirhabdus sediminis]
MAPTYSDDTDVRKMNHLAQSTSPYLAQHVYNPVDWYPWGEEAIALAKKQNKPIFLSIGYSTCHWCHVMERESFEDEAVAEVLNKYFISVKVDREERPDVDAIYMAAYHAMQGGGGGWPLNMFLTPELKPFYGGTYFPPQSKNGRPGFKQVVAHLGQAWENEGAEVVKSANEFHDQLIARLQVGAAENPAGQLDESNLKLAVDQLMRGVDWENGGWNASGPKFPQVSNLRYLLQSGDAQARQFVLLTCDKMMNGGIYDQLSGGFHRYSVDGIWLVPHFEKMLYDQAQLIELYLDAWLITGKVAYKQVVEDTIGYVLREMRHEQGAFYSAQDAGSEGKEGKFCCWTMRDLAELTDDQRDVVVKWFGMSPAGNFVDFSDPDPLPNLNVLHLANPAMELSADERNSLADGIAKMRELRAARVPAATDDKILADWNGMMISSLARASRVLQKPEYLDAATNAYGFLVQELHDSEANRLAHVWCRGRKDDSDQALSYLHMLQASLAIYQVSLEPAYLAMAIKLADASYEVFYDKENGGFYNSPQRDDLVLRLKGEYDGATPTASSVGTMQFHLLAEITGDKKWLEAVEKSFTAHQSILSSSPASMSLLASALDRQLKAKQHLVIAEGDDDQLVEMLVVAQQVYKPRLVVMGNQGAVGAFSQKLDSLDEKTTAYLCEDYTCKQPVTDAAALREILQSDKAKSLLEMD